MPLASGDLHAVEPVRVLDQHAPAFIENGVVGGVPRDREGFGDPGTVRCWNTMACNAHRNARRDSFARGSAARLMSWRHTRRQLLHW
jgi:hypothetical protein